MHYWLLTSEFPPFFGGGISTYCLETARMFADKGYNITIITQDYSVNNTIETKENNYNIVRFTPNQYFTNSFLGYEAHLSYAFAEIVKELIATKGKPDIIESQEYMGIAYYLLQYKQLQYPAFKDLKVVLTLHAPSFLYLEYNRVPHYQFPYFWIGEMEKFCIRAADVLISPSQYLIDVIKERMDLNNHTVHVVKNPYQLPRISKERNLQKNKLVFFGKLTPQKGCLELIEYFKKLWNDEFKHPLIMIGGGDHLYHPEGMDMIDFIKKYYETEIKNGMLKLLGSIEPKQINDHLNDAHLIIIPSVVDNLPYTVLEAMGRGKIVLASKQGGQSEVIKNEVNGFLFDHNQTNSFAEQIQHILSLNETELKQLSSEAKNEIEQTYNYSTIFEQKNNLLQQLISKEKQRIDFPFTRTLATPTIISDKKEETPLLSVVIPYYNMGAYVNETITSIKNQTYQNIEIIIVNDGSTEETSISALKNLEGSANIQVIHQKNQGLPTTRNNGANQANGYYLAFLDPDDTIEPHYYEKAIRVLSRYNNVHFVGCWAKYFGDNTGYWPSFIPEPPYLLTHNMINSSALIYKKEAFMNAGFNDAKMIYGMEDYESVISMLKQGYRGVVLPEPLWNYRIRKNSMARAFTNEKQLYLYRIIAEKHRDFYATFATEVTNLLNANGPGINYDNPTLTYRFLGNNFIKVQWMQGLITKVKANRLLRKTALKLINIYKKK